MTTPQFALPIKQTDNPTPRTSPPKQHYRFCTTPAFRAKQGALHRCRGPARGPLLSRSSTNKAPFREKVW